MGLIQKAFSKESHCGIFLQFLLSKLCLQPFYHSLKQAMFKLL